MNRRNVTLAALLLVWTTGYSHHSFAEFDNHIVEEHEGEIGGPAQHSEHG